MDFDVAAAHRPAEIEVEVGGRLYVIPAMTAHEWCVALFPGEGVSAGWIDIVPGLLEDGDPIQDAIVDEFLADDPVPVDYDELRQAAQAALTAAAGVKWSIARHLIALGLTGEVGGELVLRGVNPTTISLGAYVLACYRVATRNMDRPKVAEFDMLLNRPPTGVDASEWYDEEEAAGLFEAAMAAESSR